MAIVPFSNCTRRTRRYTAARAKSRHAFAQARQIIAHRFIASSALNFSHSEAHCSHIFAHASAAVMPAGPKQDCMHAEQDAAHDEQSSRHFA
jgi:hypothetical protein